MRSSFLPKCQPKIFQISAKNCIHSPKITKKSATILVCLVGQKSGKILVGILGETMISYIHSEYSWPLPILKVYGQKIHFKRCSNIQQVDLKNFLPFWNFIAGHFFLHFPYTPYILTYFSIRWSFLPQWNVFVVFFSTLTVIVIESTFMTIDHATFSKFFQSFRLETLCKRHNLIFLPILVRNFWRILLTSASLKNSDKLKNHFNPPFCQRLKIRQSKINSRWVAGPIGQTNRRPNVWCSKYYFF